MRSVLETGIPSQVLGSFTQIYSSGITRIVLILLQKPFRPALLCCFNLVTALPKTHFSEKVTNGQVLAASVGILTFQSQD